MLEPDGLTEGRTHVAEENGSVVGFATWAETDNGGMELEDLFVDPKWMRRGIATALVNCVCDVLRARAQTPWKSRPAPTPWSSTVPSGSSTLASPRPCSAAHLSCSSDCADRRPRLSADRAGAMIVCCWGPRFPAARRHRVSDGGARDPKSPMMNRQYRSRRTVCRGDGVERGRWPAPTEAFATDLKHVPTAWPDRPTEALSRTVAVGYAGDPASGAAGRGRRRSRTARSTRRCPR